MAPEQVKCLPVTVKTDVFNFGATMYFCLAGKKLPTLFNIKKGENSFLVDSKIQSPYGINPLIPEILSNLVMECVRTNAAKRPEDMVECIRRSDHRAHDNQAAIREGEYTGHSGANRLRRQTRLA